MINEDFQLIGKINLGDYQAFKILFEKYYSMLCNFSYKYLNDYSNSEDIVQEVFIKIWEDRRKLKITGSVKSYLFVAVKNRCLNKIESELIRRRYNSKKELSNIANITQETVELEEFRQFLFDCIDKLPPRCKEVFLKSRFTEMKQDQIASSLNITIKTVKAQIGKALKLVKDCLNFYYPEI